MLAAFLIFVVGYSALAPISMQTTEYAYIDLRSLPDHAADYEGRSISSAATISSVVTNASGSILETEEGVTLAITPTQEHPLLGQRIMFRGTSYLNTNNTVSVHEFYALDYNSSPIRSIPGIIIFVVLFLLVFSIDLRQLAFVRRAA